MPEKPIFVTAQTLADLLGQDPRTVAYERAPVAYLRTKERVSTLYAFNPAEVPEKKERCQNS